MFVRKRVNQINKLILVSHRRYVSTDKNLADLTSRGAFPSELLGKELWWEGPHWLRFSPKEWPIRTDISDSPIEEGEETPMQGVILTLQAIIEPEEFHQLNSFLTLIKVLANGRKWKIRVEEKTEAVKPTCEDLEAAYNKLICISQLLYFSKEVEALKKGKNLSITSPFEQVED